jgi:dynein heavy chain
MEVEDGRHWRKIKEMVKQEFEIDESLELKTVWDLKLFDFKDGIEEITDQSKQELKMERGLNVIIKFWKDIDFELIPHKSGDIFTLKMTDENFETLEDHQMQINNMLLSKYVSHYESRVERWKMDLGAVYDVNTTLQDVQKTWSFLENLFIGSEEVKKELPNESQQFVAIDRNMREIMRSGNDIKNCIRFCT